jgi:hypothetical protein
LARAVDQAAHLVETGMECSGARQHRRAVAHGLRRRVLDAGRRVTNNPRRPRKHTTASAFCAPAIRERAMAKVIRVLILAAFFGIGGLATAADVSGTWTASFETQVGTQSYTYVLQVQGGTLTGTAKSNLVGDSTLSDGKVEDNKISFVEHGTYQDMPLTFNYTGELVGDELHFKRQLVGFGGDFPPEEFVAKRAD